MPGIARPAKFAFTTACVYFSNNATANERAIRTLFNDADKLVSDRSFKTCVPARDFQIGVADSR
jgi:hypothetical protein